MSNIVITQTDSGLMQAAVVRSERITPHMVRVTLTGSNLARFTWRGLDQWVRLAIPVTDGSRFDNLPQSFGLNGYLRYLSLPRGTRPVIRNYTIRDCRPDLREIDIDFVIHGDDGDDGVAGPWAAAVEPGAEVALIDQGCGWKPVPADWNLLVADESGLPAVAGILRDMPRDATGHALVELFDDADRQETGAPDGVNVHWLTRDRAAAPGNRLLPALRDLEFPAGAPYAFAVGERTIATGARRHLVGDRGIAKQHVTFVGYWRQGHTVS